MAEHSWPVRNAKNRFSEAARRKPQMVTKHGKPAVVVMDVTEYRRLRRLERARAPTFAAMLLAIPQDGEAFPRSKVRPRNVRI